MIAIIASENI